MLLAICDDLRIRVHSKGLATERVRDKKGLSPFRILLHLAPISLVLKGLTKEGRDRDKKGLSTYQLSLQLASFGSNKSVGRI